VLQHSSYIVDDMCVAAFLLHCGYYRYVCCSVLVDELSPTITLTVVRSEGTFGRVSVSYYTQAVTDDTVSGADYKLTPGVNKLSITVKLF
jgi:hypothetical protein